MIDAGLQVGQLAAYEIQLEFIQSSRAGRGSEIDLSAAGVCSFIRDACREVENAREIRERRNMLAFSCNLSYGYCRQRRNARLVGVSRQRNRIDSRIDFQRQRMIRPVEIVTVAVNALVGMLGLAVVVPGSRYVQSQYT